MNRLIVLAVGLVVVVGIGAWIALMLALRREWRRPG